MSGRPKVSRAEAIERAHLVFQRVKRMPTVEELQAVGVRVGRGRVIGSLTELARLLHTTPRRPGGSLEPDGEERTPPRRIPMTADTVRARERHRLYIEAKALEAARLGARDREWILYRGWLAELEAPAAGAVVVTRQPCHEAGVLRFHQAVIVADWPKMHDRPNEVRIRFTESRTVYVKRWPGVFQAAAR